MKTKEDYMTWAETLGCAITVCDKDCRILFMNGRSRETFARHGDIIGHDLMQYHPPHARQKIQHMLETGDTNAYTITKQGRKKLIFQTPWYEGDEVGGLVELSIVLPDDMPHYNRD